MNNDSPFEQCAAICNPQSAQRHDHNPVTATDPDLLPVIEHENPDDVQKQVAKAVEEMAKIVTRLKSLL